MYNDNRNFNIEEYYERLKLLTDRGQREVCFLINFMEYYETHNRKGEERCFVRGAEKR